jgi:lysophospholipase L1-like esterase
MACGLMFWAMAAHSQTTAGTPPRLEPSPKAYARWQASMEAFDAADKAHAPAMGGVLFVGSSSIRLWEDLETQFDTLPVIVKRGFGGSRMSDSAQYLNRLVIPYQPRLVIVYAGENDLAEGSTPQQVLQSFQAFVEGVRQELPDTRIAYLSIKPSPLRARLIPAIRETNALIKGYTATVPNADYIDVFSKMLDPQGQPRRELYRADALHLNAEGYAVWRTVISSHVQ